VGQEALRRRGVDTSKRVVTPAATLLALTCVAIGELTTVSIAAVREQAALVLSVGLAVLVVTAPDATLSSEARRAHAERRAVGAVVGQHARCG